MLVREVVCKVPPGVRIKHPHSAYAPFGFSFNLTFCYKPLHNQLLCLVNNMHLVSDTHPNARGHAYLAVAPCISHIPLEFLTSNPSVLTLPTKTQWL